jgi:hypothetical protein
MTINEKCLISFQDLHDAVDAGNLCLAKYTDIATGASVVTVCKAIQDVNGDDVFVPLAKLFDGDPSKEVRPPLTHLYPEGWMLSEYSTDSGTFWAIQKVDELEVFDSDIEAYHFVKRKALARSPKHVDAISKHGDLVK